VVTIGCPSINISLITLKIILSLKIQIRRINNLTKYDPDVPKKKKPLFPTKLLKSLFFAKILKLLCNSPFLSSPVRLLLGL